MRRRWENLSEIISLRDLRLRVCLVDLSKSLADAAAIIKEFVIFVRVLDSLDL